jgi:hypothetical protein
MKTFLKTTHEQTYFSAANGTHARLSRSHTARLKSELLHAREGAVSGSNTESSGKPKMAMKKTWKNAWKMNLKDHGNIYIYTEIMEIDQ